MSAITPPRSHGGKLKVKTGCITCRSVVSRLTPLRRLCVFFPSSTLAFDADLPRYRIRKVKCDELKPSCNRCTHTGRKCDGYAPPMSNVPKKSSHVVRSSKKALQQSDVHVDVVLSSIFGTPEEHWSLDFFIRRTAPAISGAFDTGFVCIPLG
jgi:Fungal Zn(2)-Cys(6) binuclear cluster domain